MTSRKRNCAARGTLSAKCRKEGTVCFIGNERALDCHDRSHNRCKRPSGFRCPLQTGCGQSEPVARATAPTERRPSSRNALGLLSCARMNEVAAGADQVERPLLRDAKRSYRPKAEVGAGIGGVPPISRLSSSRNNLLKLHT
jgi:hypothetical protein